MKISTRGRYALRMMISLAVRDEGQYVSLKDISQDQDISMKYLEQITGMLAKAGLIKSARGARGGYMLARAAGDYTAGDILRVTEGSMSPVTCIGKEAVRCMRMEDCATVDFWEGLDKVINEYIDGVTLEDLVKRYKYKEGNEYVI